MKNWEKNMRQVVPYVPGEQPDEPDMIKLNTNENPYPPAPEVQEALKNLRADSLRLYPDCTAGALVHALAQYHGLSDDQVFVGVGSDEVLALSFLTFFNSKKPILFPDVTYSFYKVWAELFQVPYECPALNEDFEIEPGDYKKENGGVIFPNPNAPTGVVLPLEQIEEIIRSNPDVVVIVDEAYVDFGAVSALPLLDKYDNLLIVRTFSKSRAMAGMRIGYAMGNPKLLQYLSDVKYSFNSYTMDQTALVLGVEALKNEAYFQETLQKINDTREWTKEQLAALGFIFKDSKTNFVFAAHPDYSGEELFKALRAAHIYVRRFAGERVKEYLRITIGTREEMECLVRFLRKYTGSSK